jgi:hypothetical protein
VAVHVAQLGDIDVVGAELSGYQIGDAEFHVVVFPAQSVAAILIVKLAFGLKLTEHQYEVEIILATVQLFREDHPLVEYLQDETLVVSVNIHLMVIDQL